MARESLEPRNARPYDKTNRNSSIQRMESNGNLDETDQKNDKLDANYRINAYHANKNGAQVGGKISLPLTVRQVGTGK